MATQLQLRRGTTAENDVFIGAEAEVTVDTTLKQLRVHDGATAGGVKVAKEADLTTGLSQKQDTSNLVTSVSSASTDTEYPSAKLLYDSLSGKADNNAVVHLTGTETITGDKTFSGTNYFTGTTNVPTPSSPNESSTHAANTQWIHTFGQRYITNCITEIPQDINLELNAGTLTLKAGSKVYVPNGAGVFDTFIVETDLSRSTWGSGSTDLMVAFDTVNSTWGGFDIPNCYSGPTAPTGATNMLWYDTTNNKVKQTSNSGSTWNDGWTLPIFIVSRSSGAITSIDQVFNGFGYIGSTVFALPGVKGLIPSGFNTDGTAYNVPFTINTVLRTSLDNDVYEWDSVYYGISGGNPSLFINTESLYDVQKNIVGHSGKSVLISNFHYDKSTLKITSFVPKTVFKAVDYNDSRFIARQSMPSNSYIDLIFSHGVQYQAPADGYFLLVGYKPNATLSNIGGIQNQSTGLGMVTVVSDTPASPSRWLLPVRYGENVNMWLYNGTVLACRFIYAQGAEWRY